MNSNALDLNLIRVFDALYRERSVTRAGDRIGLSQPAVSAALNRLRHIFNDQLFVRHGNEMTPTPRAEELAGFAREALIEIERMLRHGSGLELAELERTFTLMGADFFSMLLMPHLAGRVAESAPKVRLRFLDSSRGDVAKLLLENAVDMALERPLDMPEWTSSMLLFRSPFALIASARNGAVQEVAEGQVLPLDLFCALPHALRSIDGSLSGMVDDALAKLGLRRRVTLALPHFQGVGMAVSQGPYLAAVPIQFARVVKDTLGLRVFEPPISVPVPEVKLYWHSRHDGDAAHQWMRGQVLAAVKHLGFEQAPEA